jgi:hypothetical protein
MGQMCRLCGKKQKYVYLDDAKCQTGTPYSSIRSCAIGEYGIVWFVRIRERIYISLWVCVTKTLTNGSDYRHHMSQSPFMLELAHI